MNKNLTIALLILIIMSPSCQNPFFSAGISDSSYKRDSTQSGERSPSLILTTATPDPRHPPEQSIQEISLKGPLSEARAEVSGMAWDKDRLILVPQFPSHYASPGNDGRVFTLDKAEILAYLAGEQIQALKPDPLPLVAPKLADKIPGFEGFEAIAIEGESIYMTIESSNGQPMMGYLIKGDFDRQLNRIILDTASLIPLPPRAELVNKSDEALVLAGGQLFSIYEANGAGINPKPVAYRFDLPELTNAQSVPFPNLEFRITDATPANEEGRFWVINTFWPVDIGVASDIDPLAQKYGEGITHGQFLTVERLVELQVAPGGIRLTDTPPIQLSLIDDFSARNWEGLVRLENFGFLLMTDEHPASIFAFVPSP